MRKSIFNITIYFLVLVVSLGSCTSTQKSKKRLKKSIKKSTKAKISAPKVVEKPKVEAPAPKEETNLSKEKAAYIEKYGLPQVSFIETDQGLSVSITTKRLELASVMMEDLNNYYTHLFSDPNVMEKYAEGKPRSKKRVKQLITKWVKRWEQKNPFSGLVIRRKAASFLEQGEFLGHVVLGLHPESPKDAVLAGLMKATQWNSDYGYEAAGAIVLFYAPELVKMGYKLPQDASFDRIIATARPDNRAIMQILEKLGFTVYDQGMPYDDGVMRNYYGTAVETLK